MRATLLQCLIAAATEWLAKEFGGRRALARHAGAGEGDLEPTLRRWIAMGSGEVQPIPDLNGKWRGSANSAAARFEIGAAGSS